MIIGMVQVQVGRSFSISAFFKILNAFHGVGILICYHQQLNQVVFIASLQHI